MLNVKDLGEFAEFFVRGVEHRIELAAVEFAEARDAGAAAAAFFLAASGLLLLAAMVFTVLIVATFWHTAYRLPGLAALGIVYTAAGYRLLVAARNRLEEIRGFSETAEQLHKDMACIAEIIRTR